MCANVVIVVSSAGKKRCQRGLGWGLVRTAAVFLASLWLFAGCQAKSLLVRPALEDEGELVLYLQPLSQEADNLTFSLEQVAAVREDGAEFPMALSFSEVNGLEMKRQRLLAFSQLPPGTYSGLSVRPRNALLKGEEGETALGVPEGPVRIDSPFEIRKKKSLLLELVFNYTSSIRTGYTFSPAFALFAPDRPVTGVVGYVANYGSNNITVFDKKEREAVGVIATGQGPRGIALDAKSRRAYVALAGEDSIDVIDLFASDSIQRIRLNTGDSPQEPVLTPDGRLLLTANSGSDTVSFIDPAAMIELERVSVERCPHSVAVDRTGKRAYVFNTYSSTISVIDIANKSVVTTLATEPGPLWGAFNRSGTRLYVIHEGSSYLTVIDPTSLAVLERFFVGMGMSALLVDTRTDFLYAAKKHEAMIGNYDPLSFFPVDSIQAETGVTYMTIDDEENNLYLVLPEKRALMVVNLISKKIITKIDVGEGPCWVSLMGER